MKADERREKITEDLRQGIRPLSASFLAEKYNVSRQIVVGDIAILRAAGINILATPRGYILDREPEEKVYRVACIHTGEDMQEEMNVMVDNGCRIENVIIEHPVYGQLTGQLNCSNRHDVKEFAEKAKNSAPLSELTGGVHVHTLVCPDDETFMRVKKELKEKGFLYEG